MTPLIIDPNVGLGKGWTHSFSDVLIDAGVRSDGQNQHDLLWYTSTGEYHIFLTVSGTYQVPPELNVDITDGGGTYTITERDGTTYVFEKASLQGDEGRRPRTITKQRGILTRFAEYLGSIDVTMLSDVNLRLVDRFRSFRKPSLKPKSMHNDAQALKQFLSWCADRELLDANPLATTKFSPPKSKPREGPTIEQIDAILAAASEARYPVLATLAFTGSRSGEVAHLRVEDADLTGNWLHFESRPGYETKTGESRKVPIHARLRPVIENALKRNKDGWLFTAQPSRKFPKGGHHISTKRLNEDLQRVLKKLKMPAGHETGFTVHSLRRSFKTICVNSGIPREVVDIWQGHAHVRTASDLYYSLSDVESQRFMKLVPFGDGK